MTDVLFLNLSFSCRRWTYMRIKPAAIRNVRRDRANALYMLEQHSRNIFNGRESSCTGKSECEIQTMRAVYTFSTLAEVDWNCGGRLAAPTLLSRCGRINTNVTFVTLGHLWQVLRACATRSKGLQPECTADVPPTQYGSTNMGEIQVWKDIRTTEVVGPLINERFCLDSKNPVDSQIVNGLTTSNGSDEYFNVSSITWSKSVQN